MLSKIKEFTPLLMSVTQQRCDNITPACACPAYIGSYSYHMACKSSQGADTRLQMLTLRKHDYTLTVLMSSF